MKRCSNCKKYKKLSEFSKDLKTKDGIRLTCKKCCSDYYKRYYKQYSKKQKEKSKIYRINNKEKIKKYRESRKELRKLYLKANKKRIDAVANIYRKNRYKTDINFKLAANLRGRLYKTIKRQRKSKSALELVECSILQLKNHFVNLEVIILFKN